MFGPVIGSRIIGVTPHLRSGYRGHEIRAYLDSWNSFYHGGDVEDILILDDDRDMNPYMGHLFWTDSYDGFKARKMVEVEMYLKASPTKKRLTRIRKMVRYNLSRALWRVAYVLRVASLIRKVA
jgi:hypothetical protein